MTLPYDILLLDFGGVCLRNPIELHDRVEGALGLAPGTFTWRGPVDPSTDALYRRVERGEVSEREYWTIRSTEVGAAAGRELDVRAYMELLYHPPTADLVRDEAEATVLAARAAGYGVSVLTNDLRAFHGDGWAAQIPFLQTVDHLIDCSNTGILKPDPRAFQRAVDIVGVDPERILFVDDQPVNARGGADFGMPTLWFDISAPTESWALVAETLDLSI